MLLGLVGAGVWAWQEQPTCGTRLLDQIAGRETARPNHTGTFSTDDGRILNYDFYRPSNELHNAAGEPPLVIYVHGGGWSSLTRDLGRSTPPLLLCERGYAVASLDYRRTSDGATWPTPAADVAAGIRTLGFTSTSNTRPDPSVELLSFDINRVALWGDSAGGHLASFVAMASNSAEVPKDLVAGTIDLGPNLRLRGVIAGAAITDLTDPAFATWAEDIPGLQRCPGAGGGNQSCDAFASHWPCASPDQVPGEPSCTTIIEASMLWLLGCDERTVTTCGSVHEHPLASEASPVTYADACDPPHMLLSDGEPLAHVDGEFRGDLLVPPSQQQRLIAALQEVGVDTSFSRSTDGSGHVAITGDASMVDELDNFLSSTFSGPTAKC